MVRAEPVPIIRGEARLEDPFLALYREPRPVVLDVEAGRIGQETDADGHVVATVSDPGSISPCLRLGPRFEFDGVPSTLRAGASWSHEAHVETVEAEIETVMAAFDVADLEGGLRSHRKRERAPGTPSLDAEEETRSKYRPSSCPDCGLAWRAPHGGRLGMGVERVAALVWRCMDCGDVLTGSPGESDKIL